MSQTDQYRVILDGQGTRSGTVASTPTTREAAMAGFDNVLTSPLGKDVAAGDLRVSVLAEAEYARRSDRTGGDSEQLRR